MAVTRTERPFLWNACQPAALTTNWSLLVAFHGKAFGRPANSDSTLLRYAHLGCGAIGCHLCLHLALGRCSGIFLQATNPYLLGPACLPSTTCPWSTMECSQPAAWTTNRSLLVASRVRPFQEDRPIPTRPYPELRTWKVVCIRESPVYHLAFEMYSGFVPHAYQKPAPFLPPSNPP